MHARKISMGIGIQKFQLHNWKQLKERIKTIFFFSILASIIPGICLLGVCLADCNSKIVVSLMIIATCCYGSMFSGVFSNHTDIASNYAGTYYIDMI